MSMKLQSGEIITPTGAAAGVEDPYCLEMCSQTAVILKAAGFELVYTSLRSEACYYALPGREGVLRVAAHRVGRKERQGMKRPIIACITFGVNQKPLRFAQIEGKIAEAVGRYFLHSIIRPTMGS